MNTFGLVFASKQLGSLLDGPSQNKGYNIVLSYSKLWLKHGIIDNNAKDNDSNNYTKVLRNIMKLIYITCKKILNKFKSLFILIWM